jgi:hypothetical protein
MTDPDARIEWRWESQATLNRSVKIEKMGFLNPTKNRLRISNHKKTLCVILPQTGGGYHGLWSWRFVVANRHSAADHSAACSVHAPLGRMYPCEKALGSPGAF